MVLIGALGSLFTEMMMPASCIPAMCWICPEIPQAIENLWVDYMQNGKINPASGIFLAKNMFGYKDTQDVILTPNTQLSDVPADAIVNKYKELPE